MSESKDMLKNVLWLGGSPCAGKSSISEILAQRFDLDVYHVDEDFEKHLQDLEPMKRDVRFAEWVQAEVRALGLQLLRVDGSQTIEENAEAIAAHFHL